MTKVKAPTRLVDYWTGKPLEGAAAERAKANIDRIIANEPQDTEAQSNEVWFRVATIAGILRPLRG